MVEWRNSANSLEGKWREEGIRIFIAKMDTPWSITGKQVNITRSDRATLAQMLKWKPEGSPDFGMPVADGTSNSFAP